MKLPAIALLALLFTTGCSTSLTHLELQGDQPGPAIYELQETLWRTHDNNLEVVGYGVTPFNNSPNSIGYEPHWPVSGSVIYRMHAQVEPSGALSITLLGPARTLGPGDDEILTGQGQGATVETVDDQTRKVELHDIPIKSRNRPGVKFTLSGTILARAAPDKKFDHELQQFELERSYRK
jgi:hypothetical protein